ncbi:hypothetical protein BOR84_10610 [Corynebacterium striatum]|uniref:Uncharacterized protein n=1 Tax=Corynebacterium striatum TaxID=43770 RepID=A0ABC8CIA9_CORST|nr:hypothetical protein [Corynebacterium striatum]ATZ08322.1 hypothetical protein A9D01_05625 [Corynebacterium striatum]EGT5613283.1 hypothetical protein [Corynebacterium striatum]
MTNTIEVPISLIKAGDLDAIRDLLPQENLFGRWAEHPTLGRGIIISAHPNRENFVKFVNGESWSGVILDDLTLDPVELVTLKDFEAAPEGTIISDTGVNAYQKLITDAWESRNDYLTAKEMAVSGPWKILRWGWGE